MDKMNMPSVAEMQREGRDRMVAMKIGAQVMAELGGDALSDSYRAQEMVLNALHQAAYLAIQEERALHADEIKMLDRFSSLELEKHMLTPRPHFIPAKP